MFTAASLTAGLAGNGSVLIAARAAQGSARRCCRRRRCRHHHDLSRRRAPPRAGGLGGAGAAVGVLVGGLLATRPVVAGFGVMLAASGLLISGFFLNSLLLQRVMGLSALGTGLVFLPVAWAWRS